MKNIAKKFKPYLKDPVFIEVLDLVRQNSKGKIWIIGGFVYKNLTTSLHGGNVYNYDIDFVVEQRKSVLKEVSGWEIQVNNYGSQNYVRNGNKMSFTDLKKAIRVSGLKNPTIEEFIEETPFNIQSIAYDLDEHKIIGQKGIESILKKVIKINNKAQADFYAKRKNRDLNDIIEEKAKELNFKYEK